MQPFDYYQAKHIDELDESEQRVFGFYSDLGFDSIQADRLTVKFVNYLEEVVILEISLSTHPHLFSMFQILLSSFDGTLSSSDSFDTFYLLCHKFQNGQKSMTQTHAITVDQTAAPLPGLDYSCSFTESSNCLLQNWGIRSQYGFYLGRKAFNTGPMSLFHLQHLSLSRYCIPQNSHSSQSSFLPPIQSLPFLHHEKLSSSTFLHVSLVGLVSSTAKLTRVSDSCNSITFKLLDHSSYWQSQLSPLHNLGLDSTASVLAAGLSSVITANLDTSDSKSHLYNQQDIRLFISSEPTQNKTQLFLQTINSKPLIIVVSHALRAHNASTLILNSQNGGTLFAFSFQHISDVLASYLDKMPNHSLSSILGAILGTISKPSSSDLSSDHPQTPPKPLFLQAALNDLLVSKSQLHSGLQTSNVELDIAPPPDNNPAAQQLLPSCLQPPPFNTGLMSVKDYSSFSNHANLIAMGIFFQYVQTTWTLMPPAIITACREIITQNGFLDSNVSTQNCFHVSFDLIEQCFPATIDVSHQLLELGKSHHNLTLHVLAFILEFFSTLTPFASVTSSGSHNLPPLTSLIEFMAQRAPHSSSNQGKAPLMWSSGNNVASCLSSEDWAQIVSRVAILCFHGALAEAPSDLSTLIQLLSVKFSTLQGHIDQMHNINWYIEFPKVDLSSTLSKQQQQQQQQQQSPPPPAHQAAAVANANDDGAPKSENGSHHLVSSPFKRPRCTLDEDAIPIGTRFCQNETPVPPPKARPFVPGANFPIGPSRDLSATSSAQYDTELLRTAHASIVHASTNSIAPVSAVSSSNNSMLFLHNSNVFQHVSARSQVISLPIDVVDNNLNSTPNFSQTSSLIDGDYHNL